MMVDTVPLPPLAKNAALFLDFDGTLAPLQQDRDNVWLDPDVEAILQRVNLWLNGRLAIISGRSISDLARRIPSSLMRIGGHGLHVLARGEEFADATHAISFAPEQLRRRMADTANAHAGVVLEEKGEVLALHYRGRADLASLLSHTASEVAAEFADYSIQHGKFVIELKPSGANKGRALAAMMKRAPFAGAVPVMVGDDATDEDAFAAAQELSGAGVKVGPEPTIARHRLEDVAAVRRWLMQEGTGY
jgi:trehalose 6-phosphate phosphatase